MPTVSMMLVSLISYIDRNTLALLSPTILAETRLSGEQYGYIISAFSIAYMIGNPVWGIVLDRFGVRAGMTVAVLFWTLASASHALAGGLVSFAVARALLGFGEGATFPGGLRTATQTLPAEKRSRGIAVAYSGGSLGAIVTPLLVVPIAASYGWRGAFWFTGLVGLAWLALWNIVGRHVQSRPTVAKPIPISTALKSSRLWAFMASYALGGLPLAFVIYGAAIYLTKVLGLTQGELGRLLWIPPLGWEIGYFFWGWLADRLRKAGRLRFDSLLGVLMLLSLPLAATPLAGNVPVAMAGMFFSMFVAAGFVIVSVGYATDALSDDRAGFIAGAGAGSWSAVVAVVMPVFGRLFDQGRFNAAFALAAGFPVAGYLLWWLLARRSTTSVVLPAG